MGTVAPVRIYEEMKAPLTLMDVKVNVLGGRVLHLFSNTQIRNLGDAREVGA